MKTVKYTVYPLRRHIQLGNHVIYDQFSVNVVDDVERMCEDVIDEQVWWEFGHILDENYPIEI